MKPVPAGLSVGVTVKSSLARGGRVPEGATVVAEVWPPGESTDREPAVTMVGQWDPRERCWYVVLDTTGWVPGDHQLRTQVDAGERGTGWCWNTVPVAA